MKRKCVTGKTKPQSYQFISKLRWRKETSLSCLVGLAVDYAAENKENFLEFIDQQLTYKKGDTIEEENS